jgi:hypothetical protein
MAIDYTAMEGPALLAACGADAMKWAQAFNQTAVKLGYSEMDEGWLVGWFANAIMHGHDTITGRSPITILDDGSAFFVA